MKRQQRALPTHSSTPPCASGALSCPRTTSTRPAACSPWPASSTAKGKEYFFTSPVFTKVLQQTYDLDYLFRKVKEEGV